MSSNISWHIGRARRVPPKPGTDCGAAIALHLREDDRPEPQIVVEYARGAERFASATHARRVAARYLNGTAWPLRLVVDREGNVRPRST